MSVNRLLAAAAAFWVARWAVLVTATYVGRRWGRRGPLPKDSPRPPGWMPGPFDD